MIDWETVEGLGRTDLKFGLLEIHASSNIMPREKLIACSDLQLG